MRGFRFLLPLLIFVFTGCVSTKQNFDKSQIEKGLNLPNSFSPQVSGVTLADKWWESFSDPDLNSLMERMFKDNFQLAKSYEGLRALRHKLGVTSSSSKPTLDAKIGATDRYSTNAAGSRGWRDSYELSLTASYEADIWGRIKSIEDAGRYEIKGAEADIESLYITLSADMADMYYLYQYLKLQEAMLKSQLKLMNEQLDALKSMYEYGIGDVETVYSKEKAIKDMEGSISENRNSVKDTKLNIAILMGLAGDSSLKLKSGGLKMIDLPEAVPSSVLKNRPDIKSSFASVMSVDRNVAQAVANRYPKLSFSATASYSSDEISKIVTPENFVANILGNLILPLFDADKRKLESERQKALLSKEIYSYQEDLIKAFKEADSAFSDALSKEKIYESRVDKRKLSEKLLSLSKMRYELGVRKYEKVIDSKVESINSRVAEAKAKRDLISSRISIVRAVGGSWASAYVKDRKVSLGD